MSVLTQISTAVPTYKHVQSDLAEFMCDLFGYTGQERRKLKILYAKSGIETRYSVIPDYSLPIAERVFFTEHSHPQNIPDIDFRMNYFIRHALGLSLEAISGCLGTPFSKKEITHLITVSCTGMYAPGLDIDLVQSLGLNEQINRTSVNFMGCYASLHALKQADAICRSDDNAVVLIVSVELCTIHFQKLDDTDNTTANLLFADGAAAAVVVSDRIAKEKKLKGFRMNKFHSLVSLEGKRDMAWQISSTGFLMTLSKYIPQLIEKGIGIFFEKALLSLSLNKSDISHWAIHPGGRKILEVIEKELGLKKTDLEISRNVLKAYGNMSSPTILFVLKEFMDHKADFNFPERTFAVAFGPGLTLESVILENV
jgi:predicted naringenin-chalcone synthase